MSRSYVVGSLLISLLAVPSVSTAGLMDYVHALSGPRIIGVIPVHCKLYFREGGSQCKVLDDVWKGKRVLLALEPRPFSNGELRVALETIGYFSTGNEAEGQEYGAFKVQMVSFDPIVEIGSISYKRVSLYHGVGASLNWLFVNDDVTNFGNKGYKIRLVGVTFPLPRLPELDVNVNLRIYPDGFGRDQFGFGLPVSGDRPSERVWGFSWGFAW
jgi:hypothetical protein